MVEINIKKPPKSRFSYVYKWLVPMVSCLRYYV